MLPLLLIALLGMGCGHADGLCLVVFYLPEPACIGAEVENVGAAYCVSWSTLCVWGEAICPPTLHADDAGSCAAPILIDPVAPAAVHVTRGTGSAWLAYQAPAGHATAVVVSALGQNAVRFWDACQGKLLCTVDEGASAVCDLHGTYFVIEERLLSGDLALAMEG